KYLDIIMELTAARSTFYAIGLVLVAIWTGFAVKIWQPWLIEAEVSVNIVSVDNFTPLNDACIQAHPKCVQMLLETGAQVGYGTKVYFNEGLFSVITPLCHACAAGSIESVFDIYFGTSLHAAYALHHAVRAERVDLVELLVEFGGNVNISDNLGHKPRDYTKPESPTNLCLLHYERMLQSQLCRIVLRTVLGTRALELIPKLDISQC
uniref:Ankyrin repeat and SOCS box containing 13a, tandem duplicate 1 n=1 Tax=Cyprinus carpio TaxID=7962 RepID=A0A8C1Y666_CYPCA